MSCVTSEDSVSPISRCSRKITFRTAPTTKPRGQTTIMTDSDRARIALAGCPEKTPTTMAMAKAPHARPQAVGSASASRGVADMLNFHRSTSAWAAKVDETISDAQRDCEAAH